MAKILVSQVQLSKNRFYGAHGQNHEPRGFGLWMFEDLDGKIIHSGYGNYSDQAKAAKRAAAEQGVSRIWVCS